MRASEFLSENSADLDKLDWFSIDDKWTGSYPMIKHIGQNIGATHWANWGRIGAPWNDREMIGGSGTYMMRGPFGHVMLDATTWPHKKLIVLSQISVENRGSGLGEKIMNAIKSYADNSGFKVEIYKVTNPEFFRKFSWLDDDFTYTPGVNENFADGKVKYAKPQFDVEWEEAERYPEFRKIGKEAWIELAKKGKSVTITSAKGINNTDAADLDSFKSINAVKQARALDQLKSGTVEMPIIAVYSDGWKELIGGNTRLTAMLAQDSQATIWAIKVPDEVAELAENFADGKVKGKSRPGRFKRAGVSCKGSVASLRKKAKNSSGEKQKGFHWCANMKSGRKRSK